MEVRGWGIVLLVVRGLVEEMDVGAVNGGGALGILTWAGADGAVKGFGRLLVSEAGFWGKTGLVLVLSLPKGLLDFPSLRGLGSG